MKPTRLGIVGTILVGAILAACGSSATPVPSPTPAPPTASPTVQSSPTPTATPTPIATPTPTASPTPTPAPPAEPANVVKTDLTAPATCPTAYGASCFAYKVTWTEANPAGVTIELYAVTKCLAKPHCVLPTTAIPSADLTPLGTAPASKGSLTFVVGDGETNGDGWLPGPKGTTLYVYAMVLRASSASGTSPFVIAWTW